MTDRVLPTGKCWCGCGGDTERGSFFLKGHDKKAEKGLRELLGWKDIPTFLSEHDFGDGPGKRNLYETWKNQPGNDTRPW